jgi:hypothetical protein
MVGWLAGILPRVISAGMTTIAIAATDDDVDAGAGPGAWGVAASPPPRCTDKTKETRK